MKVNFDVEIVESLPENTLGNRYECVATIRGTDGIRYNLFAEKDYNMSVLAIKADE